MLGLGWLTLRQARAALKYGRLEDAQRLLEQPSVQGHKKLWELLRQLTAGYVARGGRHLQQDDPAAAWADLLRAEELDPTDAAAAHLRQELTRLGVAEGNSLLEAAEPARALEALNLLRDRGVQTPDLQPLEDAGKDWMLTHELADRGEFALALRMFERVRRAVTQGEGVERFQAEMQERQSKFNAALTPLHDALDQRQWRDVARHAEEVLAVAPQHAEARKARTRAWKTSEPETVVLGQPTDLDATQTVGETPNATPVKRLLLWIDGVGGFLICLGNRVTLGQAAVDTTVDVPLLADVSRVHASLTRDAEGYVVEAARALDVNGKSTTKALLQSGDRVTLNAGCQIVFRLPVPVSASAKIELVGGQRLSMSVDGVLMMADTLVLGPTDQAHVPMPDVAKPVVLFRTDTGVGVRYPGEFRVNGRVVKDREMLGTSGTVSGPDFAFALEPAGARLGQRVV